MSVKIDPHDEVPTCNSFQAIVRNDQLCFEVDLNRFSNKENIEKELSTGFFFIMDYNEDRQVTFDSLNNKIGEDDQRFTSTLVQSANEYHHEASIFLQTTGR